MPTVMGGEDDDSFMKRVIRKWTEEEVRLHKFHGVRIHRSFIYVFNLFRRML